MNGTTMAELWNHNQRVENVTTRLIMSMRSGLHDYNDTAFYDFIFAQQRPPRHFLNPFDVLHRVNKSFVCDPEACGYYVSPPVELLGLAACHIQGCTSWEDLNQLAVLDRNSGMRKECESGVAFPKAYPNAFGLT